MPFDLQRHSEELMQRQEMLQREMTAIKEERDRLLQLQESSVAHPVAVPVTMPPSHPFFLPQQQQLEHQLQSAQVSVSIPPGGLPHWKPNPILQEHGSLLTTRSKHLMLQPLFFSFSLSWMVGMLMR